MADDVMRTGGTFVRIDEVFDAAERMYPELVKLGAPAVVLPAAILLAAKVAEMQGNEKKAFIETCETIAALVWRAE